jgi:hypothetical protein
MLRIGTRVAVVVLMAGVLAGICVWPARLCATPDAGRASRAATRAASSTGASAPAKKTPGSFMGILDAEEKAGLLALPPMTIYTAKNAPPTPKIEDLPKKKSLTQYGITWTFDKEMPVGQFITGDFYVVGEARVVMIDPKPLFGKEVTEPELNVSKGVVLESEYADKRARHGSMVNPPKLSREDTPCAGFDSRLTQGRYDPSLFAHLPISLRPGDALISSISRRNDEISNPGSGWVDPVLASAVLTCLAAPQPADAFRPSLCDCANSEIYLARNLKRDLLSNLPRLPSMPRTLDRYARVFQRPWQQICDYGKSCPLANMPNYGQRINEVEGEATLLLNMDYPPEQKERVIIGLAQVGIDFWGQSRLNYSWIADGAHHQGRKWPIVFAGIMLGDEKMQWPKKLYPKGRFEEDDQTAMCPFTYRGKVYEKTWTGTKALFVGHSPADIDSDAELDRLWKAGWGPTDLFHPKDWPVPGKTPASEGYRMSNASPAWVGLALAIRIMHQEPAWHHDAFFPYVDRWMTEDDTDQVNATKEAGIDDRTKRKFGEWSRQGNISNQPKWVGEMWAKYRNNIPVGPKGEKTPPAETTWK